ncbi:hypothetical protein CYMTET_40144 [Cymbomonas tetramitiformis]|uniref:Glutaredoxin domain-containing protein n=1 Tax=Cymbomonas tetramitiformis TaxID=36881 RepID=A0AAE0F395_9CHLO|nr:hypothetical protein CYMTET_40144 [Cymbomonas tetramitiformis]
MMTGWSTLQSFGGLTRGLPGGGGTPGTGLQLIRIVLFLTVQVPRLSTVLGTVQAERAAASIVAPVWTFQPWWVLLCPDGVHLADCVVQWTELQPSADTFLPGLGRANEGGGGLPDFRVLLLRVSFDEREPAGPGIIGTGEQWAGLQFSVTDPLEMQLRADMLLAVSGTGRQQQSFFTASSGTVVASTARCLAVPSYGSALTTFSQEAGLQPRWSRSFASKDDEKDTHPDFQAVQHTAATEDVKEYILKVVKENKIFIFMKGNPAAPQCGFSNMACRILDHYGKPYGSANVLEDPELRQGIKDFSDWQTIPQVYVDGEFIGGSDILRSMHESGELTEILGAPTGN